MTKQNTISFYSHLRAQFKDIYESDHYKEEHFILSPQGVHLFTVKGKLLNFCANNYLGLANHPEIIESARKALD